MCARVCISLLSIYQSVGVSVFSVGRHTIVDILTCTKVHTVTRHSTMLYCTLCVLCCTVFYSTAQCSLHVVMVTRCTFVHNDYWYCVSPADWYKSDVLEANFTSTLRTVTSIYLFIDLLHFSSETQVNNYIKQKHQTLNTLFTHFLDAYLAPDCGAVFVVRLTLLINLE